MVGLTVIVGQTTVTEKGAEPEQVAPVAESVATIVKSNVPAAVGVQLFDQLADPPLMVPAPLMPETAVVQAASLYRVKVIFPAGALPPVIEALSRR